MFRESLSKRGVLTTVVTLLLFGGLMSPGWQWIGQTEGSGPSNGTWTPVPNATPAGPDDPVPSTTNRYSEEEKYARKALANFSSNEIEWIGKDAAVYLVSMDPHDASWGKVAVAHHLPTGAAKSYIADPTGKTGTSGADIIGLEEGITDHPAAQEALNRLNRDQRVYAAAVRLLRSDYQ